MELTLVNIISNLLVIQLKSLTEDIENFTANVHSVLEAFSAKWKSSWRKMQIPNTSGPTHQVPCNKESSEQRIQISEINSMMSRLGILVGLEGNENESLGAEDLSGLFDEKEPGFDEIKEVFGVFDANKDGFIDGSELQRVVCELGLKRGCSLEECTRMIMSFDGNGDGVIDLQEFVKFMESCLCN